MKSENRNLDAKMPGPSIGRGELEAEYVSCLRDGNAAGMEEAHAALMGLLEKASNGKPELTASEATAVEEAQTSAPADDIQAIIQAAREQALKAREEALALEAEYDARRAKDVADRLTESEPEKVEIKSETNGKAPHQVRDELQDKRTKRNLQELTISGIFPAHRPVSYYDVFGVDRFATSAEIEKRFLRKIKALLRTKPFTARANKALRSLYVARDVLCDPTIRDNHDFHLLEMTQGGAYKRQSEMDTLAAALKARKDELVEAIRLTDIIEEDVLEMAIEMHDPKTRQSFEDFLLDNKLGSRDELEAALLCRALAKTGRLQVGPLKQAFRAVRALNIDFLDSLLVSIDITLSEVLLLTQELQLDHLANIVESKLSKHGAAYSEESPFPTIDAEEVEQAQRALRSMLLADNSDAN